LQQPAPRLNFKIMGFLGFLLVNFLILCSPETGWTAGAGAEVRRIGLSKVGEDTRLTVMLAQQTPVRIVTTSAAGKPQLVVEFPQARGTQLPRRLPGDDLLVEQVTTETGAGSGVRIILDLYPERPYAFWRRTVPGSAGQSVFILGLKPDLAAPAVQAQMSPSRAPEPEPPSALDDLREPDPDNLPPPPPVTAEPYGAPSYPGPRLGTGAGNIAEIKSLIPKAGPVLQGLESEGWAVSDSHNYDRPRPSRDFTLTNRRYPELVVKVLYLPANAPSTPNIGIMQLSTDRSTSESATKYQGLRQWSFARIKKNYEDIGDFFDDALKPLRVKLREETKAITLRDAAVFQGFVKNACPQHPQVADKVMSHVREKVNQRFEGVQYTVCDDPLVLLNLVDFLNVKVYFVDTR
jgi:hypothetical protein